MYSLEEKKSVSTLKKCTNVFDFFDLSSYIKSLAGGGITF